MRTCGGRAIPYALVLALLVLDSCVPSSKSGSERAPTLSNAVLYSGRRTVGKLLYQGQFWCTLTLVGKRTMLSAAHCVVDGSASDYAVELGGVRYAVATKTPYPTYKAGTPAAIDDVAVVKLASAPPVPAAALSLHAPQVGLSLVLVGYGRTAPDKDDSDTRRGAVATVNEVTGRRFRLLDPSAGLTCFGDSGGPAFASFDGKEYVVGVVSGSADASCYTDSVYCRVDYYLSWIRDAADDDINLSGSAPEPLPGEPPSSTPSAPTPDPPATSQPPPAQKLGLGSPCTDGSHCSTPYCAVRENQSGRCSKACKTDADCPGMVCTRSSAIDALGACSDGSREENLLIMTPPGRKALGEPCSGVGECQSGICFGRCVSLCGRAPWLPSCAAGTSCSYSTSWFSFCM